MKWASNGRTVKSTFDNAAFRNLTLLLDEPGIAKRSEVPTVFTFQAASSATEIMLQKLSGRRTICLEQSSLFAIEGGSYGAYVRSP